MGAIPMPDQILGPFKQRFGIEVIQQGYGQSEVMGLISRVDDGSTTWKEHSVGSLLPGIEVVLLDDDDRPVGPGEVGEFCVRPCEPHVLFNGYFGDPQATLEACRNLWYHTGDLGRHDGEGQFFFADRKRDLIRFMGRSVRPWRWRPRWRPIPVCARRPPSACRAPTCRRRPRMVAVVTRRRRHADADADADADAADRDAPVTAEELARFVGERSPHFLVPRYIEFVQGLPLTPTGKVQKFVLRRARGDDGQLDRRRQQPAGQEMT